MILKNLAIAQNRKRDEKQKRYNPMFYPSYQAEDGKWYFDNGEYHFITKLQK